MSASVHATVVALRHVEDEVRLAREKTNEQALDTIAQALPNVHEARESLCQAASGDQDPQRRAQLRRALNHIDDALSAARVALECRTDEPLAAQLREIIEHLIIAAIVAEESDPAS